MTASQSYITPATRMGANLVPGGATFRTWAPHALEVYIALGHPTGTHAPEFPKNPDHLLLQDGAGYWTGFVPDIHDGDLYRFFVVGPAREGFKRDPYARELELNGYPDCNCIVRDPSDYTWHDSGHVTPPFDALVVYQFHFGVFYAKDSAGTDIRPGRVCKFLDVIDRIEYFADLGITAIMPLPFQEFQGENSLGYNGTDLFSPEMDYAVPPGGLGAYLPRVNRLLTAKGFPPLTAAQLVGQVNQMKAFIDLCHLYGVSVVADVVYNHAGGGWVWGDQSIWFFDLQPNTSDINSLYFTNQDHAGGRVFNYGKPAVRQFLIDNGTSLLEEYHVDGLRFDQVTVIAENGGWFFAQDLTNTLRYVKPQAALIAEYWDNDPGSRWKGVAAPPYGMGFDIGYSDVLRKAVRSVLRDAAGGRAASINLDPLRDALYLTYRDKARWTVFQCIENHDLIYFDHTGDDRQPRIPAIAGQENSRIWQSRSRAKVGTGLLLTAPGVPMIFMGQEFLEDKYWSDWQGRPELLIWWEGLEGQDKTMSDQHRFTREMIWLRRKHPALSGDGINVFHVRNDNRVIGIHRWVPDVGHDVVIVASLNESTFHDHSYRIGFPAEGHWNEVFNSDVFDTWMNPAVQGNPGGVTAYGQTWDGMPASAGITLPANSLLVFARDSGGG